MPTGDLKINIYEKRLLSLTGIKTHFLDYLSDKIDERTSAIFQQTSGVLDSDEIDILPDGADQFQLDLTSASRVVVGTGEIIDLSLIGGPDKTTDIQFENALAVVYYVGVRYMSLEDGIELNPRTGDPEYPQLKDTYGEKGNPVSVTDDPGVDITLNVNSIFESGVDHSGRTVKVFLVDPVSAVESIAYFEGTVVYNAPNNEIVIPYSGSDGPLGQDTGVDPPSTTPTDYIVAQEGVTWRRNTDLSLDNTYAFIGTVTGAGAGNPPAVFDVSGQIPIFINTLQSAYDGATGSGSGRKINVADGAVHLGSTALTGDDHNSMLRLSKLGATDETQFMLELLLGGEAAIPIAILEPLADGANLFTVEAANQSGVRTLDFTRGGVDLSNTGLRLNFKLAVVLLKNGPDVGVDGGLYAINAATATSIDVSDLQTGVAPAAWTVGGPRSVSVLVPKAIFANDTLLNGAGGGSLDFWTGITFVTRSGQKVTTPFRIFPDGALNECIEIYDNRDPSEDVSGDPERVFSFTPDQKKVSNSFLWNYLRPMLIDAGARDGANGNPASTVRATTLTLRRGGGGFPDSFTPGMALAFDDGNSPQAQPLPNPYKGGFTPEAILVRGHHFIDHFFYHPSSWTGNTIALGLPSKYVVNTVGGGGTVAAVLATAGYSGAGGALLQSNSGAGDEVQLKATGLPIDSDRGFQWRFRALMNLIDITNIIVEVGLQSPVINLDGYFQFDPGTNANWLFRYHDNAGVLQTVVTAVPGAVRYFFFSIAQVSSRFWAWAVGDKINQDTGFIDIGPSPTNFSDGGTGGVWEVIASVRTTGGGATREAVLDYWEWQDVGNPVQQILFDSRQD